MPFLFQVSRFFRSRSQVGVRLFCERLVFHSLWRWNIWRHQNPFVFSSIHFPSIKRWPGEFLLPWLQTLFSPSILAWILKVIPVMKSSGNSVFKNDQDVEDWWNIKGEMIQKPKSSKRQPLRIGKLYFLTRFHLLNFLFKRFSTSIYIWLVHYFLLEEIEIIFLKKFWEHCDIVIVC